jgi:hypothetical protein
LIKGARITLLLMLVITLACCAACTHLLETAADSMPARLQYPGFSFERPKGEDWYAANAPPDSTFAEFKKHDDGVETMIRISRVNPPDLIQDPDHLVEYANNLPAEDPIVRLEPGHGAVCVRYRGRSALTVNYDASADTSAARYQDRMLTDEDSLQCIDPQNPGELIAFTYSERGKLGGSADGAREADEFIRSIKFDTSQ